MNCLSRRLKELRTSRNLSQRQLAELVGLGESTIQSYELANRSPSIDICITLADYFDVSLDYLVGRTDNPARL